MLARTNWRPTQRPAMAPPVHTLATQPPSQPFGLAILDTRAHVSIVKISKERVKIDDISPGDSAGRELEVAQCRTRIMELIDVVVPS